MRSIDVADRARRALARRRRPRSSCAPRAGCSTPRWPSPSCTGPSARTAPSRGCSSTLDIAYAGPSVLAAAVTIDKLVCKRLLAFHGLPQVEFCEVGEPGLARAGRGDAPAALGEAVAARLERRHLQGRIARGRARRGDRRRPAPRPAGDHRGRRRRPRGRVLGDRQLEPRRGPRYGRDVASRRDRHRGEASGTTSRRSTSRAGWSSSSRPRSARRPWRRVRELAADGLPGMRLHRPRALRLLRRRGRRGAGQRAQHDPGLHRDERLRKLFEASGDPLPRALRPAGPASRSSARRRERGFQF